MQAEKQRLDLKTEISVITERLEAALSASQLQVNIDVVSLLTIIPLKVDFVIPVHNTANKLFTFDIEIA